MSRPKKNRFGWDYPAGVEDDPQAPYNQVEKPSVLPDDLRAADELRAALVVLEECQERADEFYGDESDESRSVSYGIESLENLLGIEDHG